MAKYIYNCSGENKTYHSVEITNNTYYSIPDNLLSEYKTNAQLISDLALGIVQMSSNGTSPIVGSASAHVDFLKDIDLGPRDSDGSPLQRVKVTTSGWHYQLHGVEFETSKLDSIYSKKIDNTNYGFTAVKFYKLLNNEEVEITGDDLNQTFLDNNCIKTVVDWEPSHDYELVGGMLKMRTTPQDDIRMWIIGVPDVPEQYGGSKVFISNCSLSYIGNDSGIRADGRAPKYLTYNNQTHTNKLRLVFRHPSGVKHQFLMLFEIFKS